MNVTLRQLVNSATREGVNPALIALSAQPLPARTAYWLGRTLNSALSAVQTYEAARVATCERYGSLNAATNHYEFSPEQAAEFNAELEQLLDEEVEITGHPLPLDQLGEARLSGADALALSWLLAEPE